MAGGMEEEAGEDLKFLCKDYAWLLDCRGQCDN